MNNCVLLVGPICSGKTKLAEVLKEKKFISKQSNFYNIEDSRRSFGNGLMSGEMFAWANFLRQVEHPPSNDNAIYEFSGTGKNVYSVSESIKYSKTISPVKWLVVYCLAPEKVLLERFPTKVYDAPCPYELNDPVSSIAFMNKELEKSFNAKYQWDKSNKLKFNMNIESYDAIADEIIHFFNP